MDLNKIKFKKKEIVGNVVGFITTTHLDSIGDKLSKRALNTILKTLEKKPFMFNNHDHSKPPTGIVISAKIKKTQKGEYGIYAKTDVYDPQVLSDIKNKKIGGFSIAYSLTQENE